MLPLFNRFKASNSSSCIVMILNNLIRANKFSFCLHSYNCLMREREGADTDLCSVVTVTGLQGMAWSCVRGGLGWISGKGSSLWGWLEHSPQGSDHGPKPGRDQEVFGQCSQSQKWLLGMVLCRARSWAWWSLWVPFNSAYSVSAGCVTAVKRKVRLLSWCSPVQPGKAS